MRKTRIEPILAFVNSAKLELPLQFFFQEPTLTRDARRCFQKFPAWIKTESGFAANTGDCPHSVLALVAELLQSQHCFSRSVASRCDFDERKRGTPLPREPSKNTLHIFQRRDCDLDRTPIGNVFCIRIPNFRKSRDIRIVMNLQ